VLTHLTSCSGHVDPRTCTLLALSYCCSGAHQRLSRLRPLRQASCRSTANRVADQLPPHICSPIRRSSSSWPAHHRRRCPASESGGIGIGIVVDIIISSASAGTAISTAFSSSHAIQPCHRLASQRPAQHSSTPLSPALQSTLSAAPAKRSILSASTSSATPQHRVRVRSISASFLNNSSASPAQRQRSVSAASAQRQRSIGVASAQHRKANAASPCIRSPHTHPLRQR